MEDIDSPNQSFTDQLVSKKTGMKKLTKFITVRNGKEDIKEGYLLAPRIDFINYENKTLNITFYYRERAMESSLSICVFGGIILNLILLGIIFTFPLNSIFFIFLIPNLLFVFLIIFYYFYQKSHEKLFIFNKEKNKIDMIKKYFNRENIKSYPFNWIKFIECIWNPSRVTLYTINFILGEEKKIYFFSSGNKELILLYLEYLKDFFKIDVKYPIKLRKGEWR